MSDLSTAPDTTVSLDQLIKDGVAHHQAGRLVEAERAYRAAIATGPTCPGFIFANLGSICSNAGRYEEAMALYRSALEREPNNFGASFNLGNVLDRMGDTAGALDAYREAAVAKPDSPEASFRAGMMAHKLGLREAALAHFLRTSEIAPQRPDPWYNAALLLEALRRSDEAEAHYRKAMAVDPDFVEAGNNLAALLIKQHRAREAAEIFSDIVARRPEYIRAYINLAKLALSDSPAEAERWARKALELESANRDSLFVIANALTLLGRHDEAMTYLAQARGTGPDSIELRFSSAIMGLPAIYDSERQIESVRAAYREDLLSLKRDLEGKPEVQRMLGESAVGNMHPFYLAYQQRNDRELQALLGGIIGQAMAARYPDFAAPLPKRPRGEGEKIRVGVACGFFRLHTIWKLFGGWFRHIDRSKFELFAYTTNTDRDKLTPQVLAGFDHATDGPQMEFEALCQKIKDDALHVLIFPEIGMDPLTVRLASLRLAPVQCTSWGHPETTGLDTIDYVLTSALMEPEGATAHYTETLVPLPGIGVCYEPLPLPKMPFDPARFGIAPDDIIYLCCQSLYKYLPRDDGIYPAIARTVPKAKFLFIGGTGIDPFRRRLERAFTAAGLDPDRHLVMLPKLGQAEYLGLNDAAHIYLDSIGWSGGNTTFEAILAGLPIVTRVGEFMRGRHTMAMLIAMGMSETIARSEDDYVAIASKLGTDIAWRNGVAARLRERRVQLFNDRASVTALEDFLITRCVAR
ncbi:MAG TPA: tetratricopeptide repeat protein [Magnetospirillaceae bacterium]|jgi:predicted O-linked N-acetylglucosamine transferase (SPINDLY family)